MFSRHKLQILPALGLALLWSASVALAQSPGRPPRADTTGLITRIRSLSTAGAPITPGFTEAPRIDLGEDGFARSIGAPPGHDFGVANPVPGSAQETARNFLNEQRELFGLANAAIDFRILKVKASAERSHVRFQEIYSGVPVFGAELIVQVSKRDGVEAVHTSMARDFRSLDDGSISLNPKLTSADADKTLRDTLRSELGKIDLSLTTPELTVFVPSVLREPGPTRLAWKISVANPDGLREANILVLLDAQTGEVIRRYPLIFPVRNRQVSDSNGTTADPGTLVRAEGQAACGIADADNAYQFLGDTYAFYSTNHGRDAIDGLGGPMNGTTRYCAPNPSPAPPSCPPPGLAFYSANAKRMYFGSGYVADDVTAHELTHGVTAAESGLTYANASGAINESLSDVWGEFVDIGNGSANDTAANRWLIGEEIPGGAIRFMKNPPAYGHPDRINSASYVPAVGTPTAANDYGGVHANSGVNNKLCYLLTDGDTFNGQTIYGLGIPRIAKLYYEAQTSLLTSTSGWGELYNALQQSAVNLGWSSADRNNLYKACVAVEINTGGYDLYVDKNAACANPVGLAVCQGPFGPYKTIAQGYAPGRPGDLMLIQPGSYNEIIKFDKIMTVRAPNGNVVIGR